MWIFSPPDETKTKNTKELKTIKHWIKENNQTQVHHFTKKSTQKKSVGLLRQSNRWWLRCYQPKQRILFLDFFQNQLSFLHLIVVFARHWDQFTAQMDQC